MLVRHWRQIAGIPFQDHDAGAKAGGDQSSYGQQEQESRHGGTSVVPPKTKFNLYAAVRNTMLPLLPGRWARTEHAVDHSFSPANELYERGLPP